MTFVVSGQISMVQRSARDENVAGRSLFALAVVLLLAAIAGCGGTRVDGASSGEQQALAAEQTAPESPKAAVADQQVDADPQPANSSDQDAQPAKKSAAPIAASETKTAAPSATKAADQSPKPKAPGSGRIKDLTFDDLKFEMEKEDPFERSLLTPEIEELDGKPIRIRGYILPQSVFSQKGFNRFVLVRDNQECCFGPGAALFDAIVVEMEPGKTADYNIFPVAVEGKFRIKELKGPGGRHLAIYYMLASAVK